MRKKKVALIGIDTFVAPRAPLGCYSDPKKHLLLKQTPGRQGIWKDYDFFVDPESHANFDAYVIFNLPTSLTFLPKSAPKILVGLEAFHNNPLHDLPFDNEFCSFFDSVITNNFPIKGIKAFHSQTGYPWYATLLNDKVDFDFLSKNDITKKPKDLLMISSDVNPQRYNFCRAVKDKLGDKVDFYGRGTQFFDNCYDLYKDYKYVICIENNALPNYFTEKLSDVFLCNSFPIYHGCTNLADYFNPAAYETIDINDIEGSIKKIETIITSNRFEESFDLICEAKQLVLNKYNLFNLMSDKLDCVFKSKVHSTIQRGVTPIYFPRKIKLRKRAYGMALALLFFIIDNALLSKIENFRIRKTVQNYKRTLTNKAYLLSL